MQSLNNDFISDLTADIAKNEQLLKEQPIMALEPLKVASRGYNESISDEEIAQIAGTTLIDLKIDSERPPYCLWFDDTPVFGLGDISTIIGKAKGRKTFATGLLLASVVRNAMIQDRIRGDLPEDKRNVLFIDTEQSEYYAKNSGRRIYGILGLDYKEDSLPNLYVHTLRPFAPDTRLRVIEWLIYNTPNLGFVVIDGIRDIVFDINKPEEAVMATSRLMKWSTERMIHISSILHMNKGDNNARGHLGTELMNKSQTVLEVNKVEKNEEYSSIKPVVTRDKEFKPIVFGIDEDTLPYILSDNDATALKTETGREKSKEPTDWDNEQHAGILERMFAKEPQLKYGDFVLAVQNAYGNIGEKKAQRFVAHFKSEGLVKWERKGNATIYSMG